MLSILLLCYKIFLVFAILFLIESYVKNVLFDCEDFQRGKLWCNI